MIDLLLRDERLSEEPTAGSALRATADAERDEGHAGESSSPTGSRSGAHAPPKGCAGASPVTCQGSLALKGTSAT
jgi:hypothetical protein